MTNSGLSTQYLDRPDGRIAHDVSGDGPLVVCLPGMGDVRSTYRFLTPALVAAGYRVVTVDLRGHGDSDTTFSSYDDVAAGSDLIALVRHLDRGPAVLVGNSMGAGAAAWAAAEAPDDVAAIVMFGPFVRDHAPTRFQRVLTSLMLRKPWGVAATSAFYKSLNAGTAPPDLGEHITRIKAGLRRPGAWHAFVRTTRTSHAPVTPRLAEVTAPTLVVMGELDPDFPDPGSEAGFIAESLSGTADVLMVPDAGHYPQAQRPDVVNAAVVRHLDQVRPGA